MRTHLEREIRRLKRQILTLGAEVESDVRDAVRVVESCDLTIAERVVQRELRVNEMEVDIEEECLKILALHQPVASDLRYIVAVLKINHDLERIGDLAVHIAERGAFLCSRPRLDEVFSLDEMAERTQRMLSGVLEAFVNLSETGARTVCASDKEVDELKSRVFAQVKKAIERNLQDVEAVLQVMHIARHLERIADHATNIAEDLLYLIDGRIVRHQAEISSS